MRRTLFLLLFLWPATATAQATVAPLVDCGDARGVLPGDVVDCEGILSGTVAATADAAAHIDLKECRALLAGEVTKARDWERVAEEAEAARAEAEARAELRWHFAGAGFVLGLAAAAVVALAVP